MAEVMQQGRGEVENEKEALHHFKEEVIEETTLVGRRRRSTTQDASGTTTTSSSSATSRASSGDNSTLTTDHDVSVDLDISKIISSTDQAQVKDNLEINLNNSVYFHNKEGITQEEWFPPEKPQKAEDDSSPKLTDAQVQKVLSAVINGVGGLEKNPKEEESSSSSGLGNDQHLQMDIVDEIDEEVIELEFERAVEKMHTDHGHYNMYCPNCSNRITKVVLRRRKREKKIPSISDGRRHDKPLDLLGCLSCFSIFIPAAGNRLNPFRIFGSGKERESSQIAQQQLPSEGNLSAPGSTVQQQSPSDVSFSASGSTQDKGKGFNLFWIFGNQRVKEAASSSQQQSATGYGQTQQVTELNESSTLLDGKPPLGRQASDGGAGKFLQTSPPRGSILSENVIIDINENLLDDAIQGMKHPMKVIGKIEGQIMIADQHGGGDVQVPPDEMPSQTETSQLAENLIDSRRTEIPTEAPSTRSLEILKSVVYGGLMESITSLSVVSSAAASEATTLNIVALALANLIGGLVVLGHNLKDLRYGESNQTNKYQELLGRREHFLVHATLAVLSYLVFGLIPPVIYGFTFRESDDRDYKLLAVAAASLICISILANFKAYIRGQHKFISYFKTVVYYVTSAVMVSGIAFAVGELANKLMERLGWFDSSTPVDALLFPHTKSFNPSWASY